MSSNAALSAARRRRSNPSGAVPSSTNMQSHIPPANRIIQRTGPPQPQQPQFNQRMPPQQQPQFNQRMPPQQQPQQQQQQQPQMRVQPPHQAQGRMQPQPQPQPQPQSMMQPPQSSSFPPLPPPVKTAGPLYGIPIHPLMMFKTHDNKLNEHDLSIGDCFEQLKEIDDRLTAIESSDGCNKCDGISALEQSEAGVGVGAAASAGVGDLNDLLNDEVFINGVVDNIMNTTNFASIVENIIPLKEENESLKQQVQGLYEQVQGLYKQLEEWKERIHQLENQTHSIVCVSSDNVKQHIEDVTSLCDEGATSFCSQGNNENHDDNSVE